jgi:hypothetical protein
MTRTQCDRCLALVPADKETYNGTFVVKVHHYETKDWSTGQTLLAANSYRRNEGVQRIVADVCYACAKAMAKAWQAGHPL